MPAAISSREAVLATLERLFRARGFDGVSIAEISAATGLSRPSLYHYFPGGKDEMALAVLDRHVAAMAEGARALGRDTGTPAARMRTFLRALDEQYGGGSLNCVVDVFGIGAEPERTERLRAILDHWLRAFAAIATEGGAKPAAARAAAEAAVARIQGSLVMARALGDPAVFRRALAEVPRLVLPGERPSA